MSKTITKNLQDIPDSNIVFGQKRLIIIRGLAETKFGSNLVDVLVNRDEQCFTIIVNEKVEKSAKEEFKKLWTMCKIFTAIE